MNAFINGETGDLAQLMIGMRAQKADSVGCKYRILRRLFVGTFKHFYCVHIKISDVNFTIKLYEYRGLSTGCSQSRFHSALN